MWYVNAFLASFNHANLAEGEQHALRVCCLLAISPPPPGIGDRTLDVSSDLSQVHLTAIVRIVEDLASGMGRLGPHIKVNCTVISRTLIPHLEKIMNHPSCMICLRPRQMCECLLPASYDQLRASPPAFTTLTSMVPHQVTSQAGGLHTMGMSSFGSSRATMWPSMGATSTATGWTLLGQPVFPTPTSGMQGQFTGSSMAGVPPSSMGDMPLLRQTHPTTQSQQPRQQATPYTSAVDMPRRVTFTSKTGTPLGAPSYYSEAVKTSASTSGQSQGCSTERRTTSPSSGSSRPQDQYQRVRSKSWHKRGPETCLIIGATPVKAVPKDPTLYPSVGWTRDVTHLMNWFLYNEGKDLSAERWAQIILRTLAYMSQNKEEWLFE